jgi:adenine phosphoribosyltransferase
MSLQDLFAAVRTVPDFPQPGVQFKDITPLLASSRLLRSAVEHLVAPYRGRAITHVAGIESRGFILGAMIADELGCGFVPVRKHGKLPWRTAKESYELEYGKDTIEMHSDAVGAGDVVLIHDDVIATGGTAAAAGRLVSSLGARVEGYSFLIELGELNGISRLNGSEVHSVLAF